MTMDEHLLHQLAEKVLLLHSPPRLLIYGTEGIGKSTTAAQTPNPIFIQTEDGFDQIDCASFPVATTFAEVKKSLTALIHGEHDFESVIIDKCGLARAPDLG